LTVFLLYMSFDLLLATQTVRSPITLIDLSRKWQCAFYATYVI